MAADSKLQKLTEENRRLAAGLAEAQEILRALRSGEVDALVSSGNDAVYAVQLIALAVDQAETYIESLALLLERLCHATGWVYGEAWATSENRRALQRTPAWYGPDSDAIRLHESVGGVSTNPALDIMLQALRSGAPQWVRLEDLKPNEYTAALERCGLQTGLALPLVVGAQVTAVLSLWRKERDSDSAVLVRQAQKILEQAAPFVQRKREDETRRHTLEAMKGMVHERSRKLAELSGMLEQQNVQRERAEALSRDHQAASRKTKQAMEEQATLLQSILDSMGDGVVVTDLAGRVLQFNPAAQNILGDDPGDAPVDRWPEIYGLHRVGTLQRFAANDLPLVKAARGEMAERTEIFVQSSARPEGRTIAMSARPLVDHENAIYGVVAVFQDITQHKRDEARRIQRIVAQRDALVREVHHRIKNNLAGVVALLHQHIAEHPETRDINAKLEAQLYTVATMHGLEAVGNGGISLRSLIKSLGENTQSLFGRKVKVGYGEGHLGNLLLREAESVPLALALNELLLNAHKHGTGGPLEIRALREGQGVIVEIENQVEPDARIPNLRAAADNGGGLGLVRSLLPHEKASLDFERSGGRVSAIVRLPREVFDTAN
jgi:two-component sensor histidine kinase/PAS domain-containing protein